MCGRESFEAGRFPNDRVATDQPNPELARTLVAAAARRAPLILSCGIRGNVVRFMPALTITDELTSEGLDILNGCLAEAE
jgi:4-aminobutyrate aminotransferase/(S)-3-amino-2-methylpropionate transaminase